MGSLAGHVLPGGFFIFYGITWIALSFWFHLTTPSSNGQQQKKGSFVDFKREAKLSRVSYIPQPFCSKLPLDPLIKIVLSSVGILSEAFTDQVDGKFTIKTMELFDSRGSLKNVARLHHITMYGAFLVSGLMDLIALIIRIPRHMTKLFFSLAFFIEGLLFWYHTHDRDHLNVAVHSLLDVVIFITLFLSLLRVLQSTNVIINSLLGTMLLIQGTWFVHAGAILYGKSTVWDQDDENNSTKQIMFSVVLFNWHVVGDMLFTILLYIVMLAGFKGSIKYKKSRRERSKSLVWPLPRETLEQNNEEETNLLQQTPNATRDTLL